MTKQILKQSKKRTSPKTNHTLKQQRKLTQNLIPIHLGVSSPHCAPRG